MPLAITFASTEECQEFKDLALRLGYEGEALAIKLLQDFMNNFPKPAESIVGSFWEMADNNL